MKFEILISSVVLLSFSACDQRNTYISNPERKIVLELSQRRIVMLGDFAHDFPLSYHTLTSTLTTWLTMLERGESDQTHLTLFLEEDGQVADLIRQYLKSGNMNAILDFLLPSTSIERLEFYRDLSGITKRIDSMNAVLPSSRQITFDLQGPEAMNVFDRRMIDSAARAAELYFVRDRDSLTAMNVLAYFHEHPAQKGLMFFGNGHLIKEVSRKPFTGDLTPEESRGAWLGRYLKMALGDAQVFTICQVARASSPVNLDKLGASDLFILSADVPWKDSPPDDEAFVPKNFDAFVIRQGFVLHAHPLRFVFSKRIIEASLRRIELLERHRSGVMGNRFYQEAARALVFLCDTNFSTAEQWKSWCMRTPFDGLKRLRSERFQKRLTVESCRALGTREFFAYIDDFISLGYDSRVGSRTMSREEWEKYLARMWPQMILLNAIGISWIGDSTEQAESIAYLRESSGKSFGEAGQYLKWWRGRYFDVSY